MPRIELRVSSQLGYSDLLYRQKWVKLIFLHLWPQQLYRAFRFSTHTYIASVLNSTDLCHGWAIIGRLVARNPQKGIPAELHTTGKFPEPFFYMCWDMSLKYIIKKIYTSGRWHATSSLSFITIRSLSIDKSCQLINLRDWTTSLSNFLNWIKIST